MSRQPEAILFDLDGTLIDTALDFYSVVNGLRAEEGMAALPDDRIREQVSNGGVALACLTWGITREHPEISVYRQRLLDRYESTVGNSAALFKGFTSLLAHLDRTLIPWGIVTNKPRVYTDLLLERMSLACNYVVCPEDVEHTKPAPDSLLLCARQMGVSPDRCWYVGDHIRDIQAAQAANMKSIVALFGYIERHDNPQSWGADVYISDVRELQALLDSH